MTGVTSRAVPLSCIVPMPKKTALVPDKKLLDAHKTRAKGHGVDAFIAECIKKNLGFQPELKAYRFAKDPQVFASAVIMFLEARRKHDKIGYVHAGISKQLGKLELPFTGDDLRLLCEIAIAQGVHHEMYLLSIVPHMERFLAKNAGDAKLAQRFDELAAMFLDRPPGRYADAKLPARVRAVQTKLEKGGPAEPPLAQYFGNYDEWDRAMSALIAKRYMKVPTLAAFLDHLQAVGGKKPKAPWLARAKAIVAGDPRVAELLGHMLDPKHVPAKTRLLTDRFLHAAIYAAGAAGGTLRARVPKLAAAATSKLVQRAAADVG